MAAKSFKFGDEPDENAVFILPRFALKNQGELPLEEALKPIVAIAVKKGFLTGSRKFKLETKDSDYDFVVKQEEVNDHIDMRFLKKYNENSHLPTLSVKIKIGSKIFNILTTVEDREHQAWIKSTDQFIEMMENPTFRTLAAHKRFRVGVFEGLRDFNGIGDKVD